MTIALPELQKLWLCCIVHHFSYQELLLLSLIDCWSQVNPDSFGSKNGPVLAFSEDFKIQDAEDSYQNLPEQEIGEELATIFWKTDFLEKQQNALTLFHGEKTN